MLRIAIFTQDVPFYIPEFMGKIFVENKDIDFVVYCFKGYRKSIFSELKKRFEYYGVRGFIKFISNVLKEKIFDLVGLGTHSVKGACKIANIQYHWAEDPNERLFLDEMKERNYDFIFSIACPKILKCQILQTPKIGCLNYHMAELPKNRGRQPLFWALFHGQEETAVTIHWMDEKIDNGPILCQLKFSIKGIRSLDAAYMRGLEVGLQAFNMAISLLKEKKYLKIQNDAGQATYNGFPDKHKAAEFRNKGFSFF